MVEELHDRRHGLDLRPTRATMGTGTIVSVNVQTPRILVHTPGKVHQQTFGHTSHIQRTTVGSEKLFEIHTIVHEKTQKKIV